eukprot:m.73317 g.73317  ORF g.73317 m.73317 type:complete len:951 (-) comp8831_c0_seq1:151-3003(-)
MMRRLSKRRSSKDKQGPRAISEPTTVVIKKNGDGDKWGFGLGKMPETGLGVVTKVTGEGAAGRVPQMVVGVRVSAFNGKQIQTLEMSDIAAMMKKLKKVTLTLLPGAPVTRLPPPQSLKAPADNNTTQSESAPAAESDSAAAAEPGQQGGTEDNTTHQVTEHEKDLEAKAVTQYGVAYGAANAAAKQAKADEEQTAALADAEEWKTQRAKAVENLAQLTIRKPILRKADDTNAFFIDCPQDCTVWYTLTCLSTDFKNRAPIPEPGAEGVYKVQGGGQVMSETVDIEDGSTSVMCRAIAVRDEDGKQSGMAGLEIPVYPAHSPVIQLNDTTGEVCIVAREDGSDTTTAHGGASCSFEYNIQYTRGDSAGEWTVYDGPFTLKDQGTIRARAQSVWCTRSAVAQTTAYQVPPARMIPVVDKPTRAVTAYKVFGGNMGNGIRVYYAWDQDGEVDVTASTDSTECTNDVIDVVLDRPGERTLSVLVTQPNRMPSRSRVSVTVPALPAPTLGDTESDDTQKGLFVTVTPPQGFPTATMYYSWLKKATLDGTTGSRVKGSSVPVLANRTGARTLSVVAGYPGHVASSAERAYHIECSETPVITARSTEPQIDDTQVEFGTLEFVGTHTVSIKHANPFATVMYSITPASDAKGKQHRKPSIIYKEPFVIDADKEVVVSAEAVAPGEAPSELTSIRLDKLITTIDRQQTVQPKLTTSPGGVTVTCASHGANLHCTWVVNGQRGDPFAVTSGTKVPVDVSQPGTHVLEVYAAADGLGDSETVTETVTVKQLPPPQVNMVDKANGVYFKMFNTSSPPGINTSDVSVRVAFGVSKKGGDLSPTDSSLTWTSKKIGDAEAWASLPHDFKGNLKPMPFMRNEYLPATGQLDVLGSYFHVWARNTAPGWTPSEVYTHQALRITDMSSATGGDVKLRNVKKPTLGGTPHTPKQGMDFGHSLKPVNR